MNWTIIIILHGVKLRVHRSSNIKYVRYCIFYISFSVLNILVTRSCLVNILDDMEVMQHRKLR